MALVEVERRDAEESGERATALSAPRARPPACWRVFALLLALVAVAAAHGTATALAADGLPPGVPVPAWAKGKKVHFDPAEPQNTRLAGDDAGGGEAAGGAVAASSAKVAPFTSSPQRLLYHGGTIQNEPHLMLVFLGEEWESGSALALRRELEATAERLPGSKYQEILTQYSSLDGPISSPLAGSPVIEKYYVKRAITTKISSTAAVRAAKEVIGLTGGSGNTNTTYAVLPAPGTAEEELRTCGFHEEYGGNGYAWEPGPSIAVIMDTEVRIGCNTSKTLTHEYAESVTDPNGESGWNTGDGGNDEIADLCNDLGPGRTANGALVAYLWDDSKDACEIEDDDPGSVPIGPYADTSHRNPSLEGATNLTPESEALETSIYPCDLEAHYYLEYGTTTAYGSKSTESVVPAAWGAVKVSTTITGLQHSTPYHWRVVVKTSNGTADGVDHEFTIPYDVEIEEEGATNVGLSEATLNGEVQPVGVEAKYYFEYGTTGAYGAKTPEAVAGSGKAFVKVSASLSGLELGTLYHYRLVASSSRGTTIGKDQTFATYGGKPVVETTRALSIGYTEAELNAMVDAKGVPTTFYFEYGTSDVYGQRTPERVYENDDLEEAGATISELEPATTYHFRIVATNSYGTTYGADESFSTRQEPLVETTTPAAVGYDEATLTGTIDPRDTEMGYYFEYGTSLSYGERTAELSSGSPTRDIQAAVTVNYLKEDTTYHFRIVAETYYGTFYGADHAFSTGVEPFVQTNAPVAIGSSEATLGGTIDPHGAKVAYYFEYGITPGYGMSTAQASAGSGESEVEASQAIADLAPDTTYHYRLVAAYGSVKQYGNEMTFTTTPRVTLVEPTTPTSPTSPTTPLAPPANTAGPQPLPTPVSPVHDGLSLQASQRGSSLLVTLGLDAPAVRVEVDAAVPGGQLSVSKRKGNLLSSVVLGKAKRSKVEAGQLKLVLALDAKGRQALKHRGRLTLTLTVTVTSSSGEQQRIARTLAIVAR